MRSLAGLRVNTCTVACGRGSSPTPYSPPSAETVSLRVNTRSCAYGGANSPAPYLHPVQRQLSYVGGGVGFQSTRFAPNTIKGRCFFSVNNLGTRSFCLRGKNSFKRPKQTFAGILPQNGGHLPQFSGGKQGGGATQIYR